jgi:TRAP-type C4-dicarboxylate transport system permease small subunit
MKNKITLKMILTNLDAIITAVTLSICVVLVNANVIMRYFFNSPIRWAEEVVTSLFVWTVFIGSAYAYRKHSHLGVDILVNLMPPKLKAVVKSVMSVVELLVLSMLTWISSEYVYHLIYNRAGKLKIVMTDMLRIPKWWTAIAVPIGFGLSVIYSVYFMVKAVRAYMAKKKEGGNKA